MKFLGTQNQILHYFQSEVDIPSKMDILDLYHVMKLQNFLSSGKFHTYKMNGNLMILILKLEI